MTEEQREVWDKRIAYLKRYGVEVEGRGDTNAWFDAAIAADAELKRLEALVEELESRNTQLADMHTAACGEHAATLQKVKRLEAEVAACITRNGEVSGRNSIQRDQIMDLEAEVSELRRDKVKALDLAQEMRGYVKSYGLDDTKGPLDSTTEWDRWKDCSMAIDEAMGGA